MFIHKTQPSSRIHLITITRDDEIGFTKTLNSVIAQECSLISWTIVDGTRDNRYCQKYLTHPIVTSYIESEPEGIYSAYNIAIEQLRCSPGWTIFLNGGDTFSENTSIKEILHAIDGLGLSHEGKNILGFGYYLKKNNRNIVARSSRNVSSCSGPFGYRIPTCHQAMVFPWSAISRYHYNTSYKICGDGEYFWRLYGEGFLYIPHTYRSVVFSEGGYSMFYPGLLKQQEVWRFLVECKSCSPIDVAFGVMMSFLSTMIQRILFVRNARIN